jgi:tRNA A37 threonylcarbamoyltransferase TsaD
MKSESSSRCGRQTPVLRCNQRSVKPRNAIHDRFGGVVPESASRAQTEMIERVMWAALEEAARFRELASRRHLRD